MICGNDHHWHCDRCDKPITDIEYAAGLGYCGLVLGIVRFRLGHGQCHRRIPAPGKKTPTATTRTAVPVNGSIHRNVT